MYVYISDGVIESIDDTDTDMDEVENNKSANVDKSKLLVITTIT